jgi:dipeptidyl aminopeptidase/acylaminoacyl peptidase
LRFRVLKSFFVIGAAATSCLQFFAPDASAAERRWTPNDSISLREFALYNGRAVVHSPDGEYFFFTTHHGEPPTDSNIFELNVHSVRSVVDALAGRQGKQAKRPEPVAVARIRSFSSTEPGIKFPQWDDDSRDVVFLGRTPSDTFELYRLNVESRMTEQLTTHPDGVGEVFEYRNGGLIYSLVIRGTPSPGRYPVEPVERDESGAVILPLVPRSLPFYTAVAGNSPRPVLGTVGGLNWIAPNGRMAITLVFAGKSPDFAMIELETGRVVPIDASSVGSAESFASALWSRDSKRVILVSSTVPQGSGGDGSTPTVAEYELDTKRWQVLEPLEAKQGGTSISWLTPDKELLVSRESGSTLYTHQNGRWNGRTVDNPTNARDVLPDGLSIVLRQGTNEPPALVALMGKKELVLTASDPALQNVWMARQEPFSWQEEGRILTGGLWLPRDYKKGQRLPLVIQAYRYTPELFLPDGPHAGTSDAAQTLVADGYAVVQIPFYGQAAGDLSEAAKEGPGFVARIDAVVDALAGQGIVNPDRVGLTGFSRGGYATLYALTHPGRVHIGAAVCADSFTGTYSDYLSYAAKDALPILRHGTIGEEEFWKNKQTWLEHETSFNVDRIQTPVMYTQHGITPSGGRGSSLEFLGMFRLNEKPLEYLYFPYGRHGLIRPAERAALTEAVVDWMNFWLRGKGSPNARKADQNERWGKIKEDWEKARARTSSAVIPSAAPR